MLEKGSDVGGVWSTEANEWSRVNTSEPGYRLLEQSGRTNQFHTPKSQFMWDCAQIASTDLAHRIKLQTSVISVRQGEASRGCEDDHNRHLVEYELNNAEQSRGSILAKHVVLCVNRRIGKLRQVTLKDEHSFKGVIRYGVGNQIQDVDYRGKRVLIIGGGAFAAENARTAIEEGAARVTMLSRRRGTVMPHIVDYLNYARPHDENFTNTAEGSARSFAAMQAAFEACGATPPECWQEGTLAPSGQAPSVSDMWLVAHHYGLLRTR